MGLASQLRGAFPLHWSAFERWNTCLTLCMLWFQVLGSRCHRSLVHLVHLRAVNHELCIPTPFSTTATPSSMVGAHLTLAWYFARGTTGVRSGLTLRRRIAAPRGWSSSFHLTQPATTRVPILLQNTSPCMQHLRPQFITYMHGQLATTDCRFTASARMPMQISAAPQANISRKPQK